MNCCSVDLNSQVEEDLHEGKGYFARGTIDERVVDVNKNLRMESLNRVVGLRFAG